MPYAIAHILANAPLDRLNAEKPILNPEPLVHNGLMPALLDPTTRNIEILLLQKGFWRVRATSCTMPAVMSTLGSRTSPATVPGSFSRIGALSIRFWDLTDEGPESSVESKPRAQHALKPSEPFNFCSQTLLATTQNPKPRKTEDRDLKPNEIRFSGYTFILYTFIGTPRNNGGILCQASEGQLSRL